MNESTTELLIELLSLLKEYGSEEFQNASKMINGSSLSGQFSEILQQLSHLKVEDFASLTSKEAARNNKPARKRPVRKVPGIAIATTRDSDFEHDLRSGKLLPKFDDVMKFLYSNSIGTSTARNRREAVQDLLESFRKLPAERTQELVDSFQAPKHGKRNTLSNWSDIILNSEISPREDTRTRDEG